MAQNDVQVSQLDIDICRSDSSGLGNNVLATAELPIPFDTLDSVQTFSGSDLIDHGTDWTVTLNVTDANPTQLQSAPVIAVDSSDISIIASGASTQVGVESSDRRYWL